MKIRNIIFDLGNVLISFNPREYLVKKEYPENIRNIIMNDIFNSREWKELDKGNITTQEAIESIAANSSLRKQEIELVFNFRTEIMFPLELNVRLLPGLKKRGFGLFYLSNFPLDTFEEIKNDYYFFTYFDGGIISSEVKVAKPDPRIYEILLEKYLLQPQDSLFIDDIEANVLAAVSIGMNGITTNGSADISGILTGILDSD